MPHRRSRRSLNPWIAHAMRFRKPNGQLNLAAAKRAWHKKSRGSRRSKRRR